MNKIRKIILFCMALLILTPSFSTILGYGDILAINENRNKQNFPTFEEIQTNGFQTVNSWYNDSFGLRDLFIRLQHQIDYSMFNYSKTLFFGGAQEKQYLFYRSVIAEEQIENEMMTEEEQNRLVDQFLLIKNKLEERNISFKYIIAPQKNEILTNESANIPVVRPENNMYYIMQDKFESCSLKSNYVNVVDELKEQNEKVPTFYYSDFHWNDWGAACAFGKVLNEYAEDLNMGKVYDPTQLEISTFSPERNFAQLASLSVFSYNAPDEYTANYTNDIQGQWIELEEYPDLEVWQNNADSVFDGAVLFIGDSYTPPAIASYNETNAGIVTLFSRTYFCHWDYSEGILNDVPEDVELVIIESIESSYFRLNNKLELLY